MKCHEAEKLMDKYLENALDNETSRLFEEHIDSCKSCKTGLTLARSLFDERNLYNGIKAPEGFTDTVMASVLNLKVERDISPAGSEERWRPVYRRLGFSLVLTAGIIFFSIVVPVTGNYPSVISRTVQSGIDNGNTSGFKNILTGIDAGVRNIFRSINNSVADIKGGTENEM